MTFRETAAFFGRLSQSIQNGGVSATAFGPLLVRWSLHQVGTRPDPACDQLLRALPGISWRLLELFPDGLPPLVKRGLAFAPSLQYPAKVPSNLATMMTHRTGFFDSCLRENGMRMAQIVLLGAGWDTRAYGLLKQTSATIFEVDAPGTQAVKRQALADAGINSDGVVFVSAEFSTESWLEKLQQQGFDPNQPTFFLWEGVTYYLDQKTIEATLANVAVCAAGSLIAFDYFSADFVEGRGSISAIAAAPAVRAAGEPFQFGIATTAPAQDHLIDLLSPHQLELVRYEPFGRTNAREKPFGGLALARCVGK